MTTPTPSGLSKATKILGLIGVMAGALGGFLFAGGMPEAGFYAEAVAVTATAGAHFT